MATKIIKTGNYLVVSNTTSGAVDVDSPTKDIYFKNNGGVITFYKSDNNQELGRFDGYPLNAVSPIGTVELTGTTGTKAAGTITLASASIGLGSTATITCDTVVAGDTVTVNGLQYTAVDGIKADNTQFSVDTGDNETATDLADSIENDDREGTLGDTGASSTDAAVTVTQTLIGVGGDSTTIATSNETTLAITGFASGREPDTVTVNGLVYNAVTGTKADNTQFSIDTDDDTAATDLADSIANDTREGTLYDVTAGSTDEVVTVTSSVPGTGANAITLESSDGTRLAVSGANLSGALDDALVSSITVDSVEVLSDSVVFVDSLEQTAINIAEDINSNTSDPNYTATASGNTVSISSLVLGTDDNDLVVASTTTKVAKTDSNLTGGTTEILDSNDDAFANIDALLTFLRANTGA